LAALDAPGPGKKHECEARVFLHHPDMRIVGVCTKKASPQSSILELALSLSLSLAAPDAPARNRAES